MTELQLQQAVAAYVNRGVETFRQGDPPVDLLRVAINNAKKWAQRRLDFELARTTVLVSVNSSTGGLLSSSVLAEDESTVVQVNRIEKAYLNYTNGQAYRPISITSKRQMARRNKVAWNGLDYDLSSQSPPTSGIYTPALIRQGDRIFVSPVTQDMQANGDTISVALDVVRWMPDFDNAYQTDFFTEFCSDWLMYRTIREITYYGKDSNRVLVTSGLMEEAWQNVVDWNASLSSDDDNDLS